MKLAIGVVITTKGKPMVELPTGSEDGSKFAFHIANYVDLEKALESHDGSVIEFGYSQAHYVALFRYYDTDQFAHFVPVSKVELKPK